MLFHYPPGRPLMITVYSFINMQFVLLSTPHSLSFKNRFNIFRNGMRWRKHCLNSFFTKIFFINKKNLRLLLPYSQFNPSNPSKSISLFPKLNTIISIQPAIHINQHKHRTKWVKLYQNHVYHQIVQNQP